MELIEFAKEYKRVYSSTLKTFEVFPLEKYEEDFLEKLLIDPFVLNLASRQMNLSTLLASYVAWFLIFHEDEKKTLLVVGPKRDKSVELLAKAQVMIDFYQSKTGKADMVMNNRAQKKMQNGNQVLAVSTKDGFCGVNDIYSLVIDDAAHVRNLHEILKAAWIVTERAVLVSSPSASSYFEQLWEETNFWVKNEWHYSINPRYTPERLEEMRKVIGDAWDQEMELKFVQTGKQPKSKIIPVRVDENMLSKIGEKLIMKDITISDYIRGLIEKDLAA